MPESLLGQYAPLSILDYPSERSCLHGRMNTHSNAIRAVPASCASEPGTNLRMCELLLLFRLVLNEKDRRTVRTHPEKFARLRQRGSVVSP